MATREQDQRQRHAGEQERDQRRLTAEAGHAQLVDGLVVGERLAQIELVDDLAHVRLGLVAQAGALGFGGHARAFAGADLLALERHRLDARRQPVALEQRLGHRVDRGENGNRREHRDQEVRVGDAVVEESQA